MLLLWTLTVFFWEIHVFLQLSWIGLFGTKSGYIHLEKSKLQEVFLSKSNAFLSGEQCARWWRLYARWFYCRDTCGYSSHRKGPISNMESLSPLGRTYVAGSISFKNYLSPHREAKCLMLLVLTQIVFLRDIPVFPHLSWIGLFGEKWAFL